MLQGGAWLKKHTGKDYDSFKAYAKAKTTKTWCDDMGLNANFSCTIDKHTQACAHALCHLWQARMSHLKAFHAPSISITVSAKKLKT